MFREKHIYFEKQATPQCLCALRVFLVCENLSFLDICEFSDCLQRMVSFRAL